MRLAAPADALQYAFALFTTAWGFPALLLLLAGAVAGDFRVVFAAGFITLIFINRAAFGFLDFNVMERFVAYLYAPYVVLAMLLLAAPPAAIGRLCRRLAPGRSLVTLLAVFVLLFGGWRTFRVLQPDIDEMNQAMVAPSRWISENIPPTARLCMEPAGALRVFTENYLVDVMGLTTTHVLRSRGQGTADMLRANHVDYCFIYPHLTTGWNMPLRIVKHWDVKRRHSLGDISLFALPPQP